MPKQRFYNLPMEKRERIINSAIKEFSRVPVNEVSINKIIKGANISRGSFYQYFEDKNDLIREIVSGYKDVLINTINQHLKYKDKDIFSLFIEILEQAVDVVEKVEHQKLCFYILDTMKNNEEFFHNIVSKNELDNIADMIISLADTSNFKYSTKEDMLNVLDIISAIGFKTIMKIIKQPQSKLIRLEEFKRQLMIIKTGILIEK